MECVHTISWNVELINACRGKWDDVCFKVPKLHCSSSSNVLFINEILAIITKGGFTLFCLYNAHTHWFKDQKNHQMSFLHHLLTSHQICYDGWLYVTFPYMKMITGSIITHLRYSLNHTSLCAIQDPLLSILMTLSLNHVVIWSKAHYITWKYTIQFLHGRCEK